MNIQVQLAEVARIAEQLSILCDDDERLFQDMLDGESDLHRIITRLHGKIASDAELIVGIAERQADLGERKRRITDRQAAMKAAVGQFLRAAKLTKLELPEVTISVRDGKPALSVVNPEAVPEAFCRTKVEPNKPAINEAFAAADELPNWLVREPARDVVTMRTK